MIIDDAVFAQQYSKLQGNKQPPVFYTYVMDFLDENNESIAVHNVTSLTRFSHYDAKNADDYFVKIDMFKSKYFKLLQCNRRLLTAQLSRTLVSVLGTKLDATITYVETYNAYILNPSSEAIETRAGALTGTHIDDLGELVEVDIQLVEKGLSEYRLWGISGVYRNVTMERLLQGLMSHPLKSLSTVENKGYRVHVAKPDNQEVQYQLKIPDGINLIDMPGWLQKTKGVYSGGIAYYLYMGTWYVFPPYDLKAYEKNTKRMTIINIPRNEMMGITNSYALEDDELYVYATGDTKHIDTMDRNLDVSGTGFKVAKTGNVLNHFTESSSGKTIIPKGRNFVNVSFEQRDGLYDNIKTPGDKLFSSNPWDDASGVIKNMGNLIIVNWESSNPYLIYPGMPVKFIYKYGGVPYSIYGVLLRVETFVRTLQESITDIRYVSNSTLAIFCERATR